MDQKAYIVVDMGFGDAGKGSIVDYLCQTEKKAGPILVVRFNGGPQAAHNVVLPDGTHHTFSQFGSGTFAGADTYLAPLMWVDPIALLTESDHLKEKGIVNPLGRIHVSRQCGVITPWHQAMNQLRELCRTYHDGNAHGSCGVGFGEAMADFVYFNRMLTVEGLRKDDLGLVLTEIRNQKATEWESLRIQFDIDKPTDLGQEAEKALDMLYDPRFVDGASKLYKEFVNSVDMDTVGPMLKNYSRIIFEGAQGILIDQRSGFHPYTTWSNCTSRIARVMLEHEQIPYTTIGVTRTYMVRHGRGPLPTERHSPLYRSDMVGPHNVPNAWQGESRIGHLDLPMLRYAKQVDGRIDALAVTHVDKLSVETGACNAYLCRRTNDDGSYEFRDVTFPAPSVMRTGQPSGWIRGPKPGEESSWLQRIADLIGLPIMITSSGPTWKDKKLFLRPEKSDEKAHESGVVEDACT